MKNLGHKEVTKGLRRLEHSAVRASGEFFRHLSSWFLRLLKSSLLSPFAEDTLSKNSHTLPLTPRGTPRGPRHCSVKLTKNTYLVNPQRALSLCLASTSQRGIRQVWTVPAHLLGWLPEYAQWTVYLYICAIWSTECCWHAGLTPTSDYHTRKATLGVPVTTGP